MMTGHAAGMWIMMALCVLLLDRIGADSGTWECPRHLPRSNKLRSFQHQCYEFFVNELYWDQAQNHCTKRGGNLVQIRNHSTQLFIMLSLNALKWPRNGVWIGAHDRHQEGKWMWVTGDRVTWGYWESGQPSCIIFCHEDCAVLRVNQDGRWHDYACHFASYHYSFICQYDMVYRAPPTTTTTTTTTTPTTTTKLPTTTTLTTTTTPTSSTRTTTSTAPTTTTTATTTSTSTTTPTATTSITTTIHSTTTVLATTNATAMKTTRKITSRNATTSSKVTPLPGAKSTIKLATHTSSIDKSTDAHIITTPSLSTLPVRSTPTQTATDMARSSDHGAGALIYGKNTVTSSVSEKHPGFEAVTLSINSTSIHESLYTSLLSVATATPAPLRRTMRPSPLDTTPIIKIERQSDDKYGTHYSSSIAMDSSKTAQNLTSPITVPLTGITSRSVTGPSTKSASSDAQGKESNPSYASDKYDSNLEPSRQVNDGSKNKRSNNSAIIGGALGSISLLILIFSLLLIYKKRHAKEQDSANPEWSVGFDNPGYGDARTFIEHNPPDGYGTNDGDLEARHVCKEHTGNNPIGNNSPTGYENLDRILGNGNTFHEPPIETFERETSAVPPLCALNPLYDNMNT